MMTIMLHLGCFLEDFLGGCQDDFPQDLQQVINQNYLMQKSQRLCHDSSKRVIYGCLELPNLMFVSLISSGPASVDLLVVNKLPRNLDENVWTYQPVVTQIQRRNFKWDRFVVHQFIHFMIDNWPIISFETKVVCPGCGSWINTGTVVLIIIETSSMPYLCNACSTMVVLHYLPMSRYSIGEQRGSLCLDRG